MSDYGKLMSSIWGDKDFTKLNAREQQVFMMLFSFPTRNLAGVLPLTLRRWATVTSDATVENIRAALRVLIRERFIIVDWDTEEVLIRTYIRNDEVWKQPNLMVRCLKYCEAVASEPLKAAIAIELTRLAKEEMPFKSDAQVKIREATLETAKALDETFGGSFREASMDPLFDGLGDTFAEPPGDSPPPTPAPSPPPSTGTSTNFPPPSENEKSKEAKDKRGTRLPDGWQPPDEVIRAMHEQFPAINLRHEHEKFCDYWSAKGGKDGCKLDWVATWRNWIRSAAERLGVAGSQTPSTTDRRVSEIDALRDNPRLAQNQNRRFDALFPTSDRKELTDGS